MTRETFVELEITGPADQAAGFVEGFRVAHHGNVGVWYAGQENVELESLMDGIKSKLDLEQRIILPKQFGERIQRALEDSKRLKIRVTSIREIERAELEFRYEVFSREEAASIRSMIEENLPENVELEDYTTHETVDEDAKGVELYGPVHDYILKGSGRLNGDVPGIIEMAHRLTGHDFIKTGKIVLHYRS
ncbi:MAG: hypothetical protein GXP48_12690 [Acidobacteria bacterium]|nr:hypothetical protein [Acidobacteriota bacterium]